MTDLHITQQGGDRNPHEEGAALRSYMTVQALGALYSAGARNVVAVYGSDRDARLNKYLNRGVPLSERMEIVVHGGQVVPADILRRRAATTSFSVKRPPGFLFVNVYDTPAGPVTPTTLAPLIREGPLVLVHGIFRGVFGLLNNTGAWMRDHENKIVAFPDTVQAAYGPHSPLDWAVSAGTFLNDYVSFAWTPSKILGEVQATLFCEADVITTQVVMVPAEFNLTKVLLPDLSHPLTRQIFKRLPSALQPSIGRLIPQREVMVDTRRVADLRTWLVGRSINTYTLRQIAALTRSYIDSSEVYKRLKHYFPNLLPSVLQDTLFCALTEHIIDAGPRLDTFELAFGSRIADQNASLRAVGTGVPGGIDEFWDTVTDTAITVTGVAVGVGVVAGLGYLAYRTPLAQQFVEYLASNSVPANFAESIEGTVFATWLMRGRAFVGDVIKEEHAMTILLRLFPLAVAEELLKRAHWLIALGLPVLEVIGYAGQWFSNSVFSHPIQKFLETLGHGVLHAAKHSLFTYLPLPFGVLAHLVHNAAVLVKLQALSSGARACLMTAVQAALALPIGLQLVALGAFAVVAASLGLIAWLVLRRNGFSGHELSQWDVFHDTYYAQPDWGHMPDPHSNVRCYSALPVDGRTNTAAKVSEAPFETHEPPSHLVFDVKQPLIPVNHPSLEKVHYFLAFNVPMYSVSGSAHNKYAVAMGRLLKHPPCSDSLQRLAWVGSLKHEPIVFDLFSPADGKEAGWKPVELLEGLDDYVAQFKGRPQEARNTEAAKKVLENVPPADDICFSTIPIMVKTNELLFRLGPDGGPALRPRAINNVDSVASAMLGSAVMIAMKRFKQKYNIYTAPQISFDVVIRGKSIRWHQHGAYAGDCTSAELTLWLHRVLNSEARHQWSIVAGDDSLTIMVIAPGVFITIEADRSTYDASQLSGPVEYENRQLELLGVTPEILERIRNLGKAKWLLHTEAEFTAFVRTYCLHRLTGGPKTTFGNSVNTLVSEFVTGRRCIESGFDDVRGTYLLTASQLGFSYTLQVFDEPLRATFLKGMWWKTANGGTPVWSVLPTRVVKSGKSLVNPETIYKASLRQLPRAARYEEGARMYLASNAANYATFAQVPVLRTFVTKYRRQGVAARNAYAPWRPIGVHDKSVREISERIAQKLAGQPPKWSVDGVAMWLGACGSQLKFSPGGNGVTWSPVLDEEAAWEQMVQRYGGGGIFGTSDFKELEAQLRDSSEFAFLEHPLWIKMMEVDY